MQEDTDSALRETFLDFFSSIGLEARIRVIKRHKDSKMAGDTLFSTAYRGLISFSDFLACPLLFRYNFD